MIRKRVQDEKAPPGLKLLDLSGCSFRLFVTNSPLTPEEDRRDSNQRADAGNCTAELKYKRPQRALYAGKNRVQ